MLVPSCLLIDPLVCIHFEFPRHPSSYSQIIGFGSPISSGTDNGSINPFSEGEPGFVGIYLDLVFFQSFFASTTLPWVSWDTVDGQNPVGIDIVKDNIWVGIDKKHLVIKYIYSSWTLPSDAVLFGSTVFNTKWWFHMSFMFTPTWGRFPIWLIFFRWTISLGLFARSQFLLLRSFLHSHLLKLTCVKLI